MKYERDRHNTKKKRKEQVNVKRGIEKRKGKIWEEGSEREKRKKEWRGVGGSEQLQ